MTNREEMNNKDKATPRPWERRGYRVLGDPLTKDGKFTSYVAVFERIADAELCVKAVNRDHLFDELLTMLRRIQRFVYEHEGTNQPFLSEIHSLLSKAEGREG